MATDMAPSPPTPSRITVTAMAELTLETLLTDDALAACALQERARLDFGFFCREVLGYHDMNQEHEALCAFLQSHPARTKLILMPRYTFKSSIATIGYSLWRLLVDPNDRLLLYADATEKAEGFLAGIKHHLTGQAKRSLFRAICGDWVVDPKHGVWNQSAISIAPRTAASVEASLETAGLETSKVGKHYTTILFDDLVSEKNVTTKDLMDKVVQVFKTSGSLLQPSGTTVLTGTRWHFGDLYGRLLIERHDDPAFAVFHRKAHEGPTYFFANIGAESLTPEFLARKKAEQGTRLYSALYQNEPTDDETAIFKAQDFRFYAPQRTEAFERWTQTLYITATLDAIPPPVHDHGDDAALLVVGTDPDRHLYLLDALAGRLTPEQQVESIFALHARWRFHAFGLETNSFQRMIKSAFDQRLRQARAHPTFQMFSIHEFTGITQGNKEQRIQGLQPWHEQGLLHLPGSQLETLSGVWSKLAWQMLQFPHSQHDDLLDALAYHLQLIRPGTITPQPIEPPVTSAAWFEREQRKEHIRQLARRPRWTRTPLPELVFS